MTGLNTNDFIHLHTNMTTTEGPYLPWLSLILTWSPLKDLIYHDCPWY